MTEPAELSHDVLLRVAEFLRRLPTDALADLAAGTAKLELVPKPPRLPVRRPVAVHLPVPPQEIGAALAAAEDRARASAYLDGLRLTVPQLRALAAALGITVPSRATRAQTRDTVVHWTVGRRMDSNLLGRTGPRRQLPNAHP